MNSALCIGKSFWILSEGGNIRRCFFQTVFSLFRLQRLRENGIVQMNYWISQTRLLWIFFHFYSVLCLSQICSNGNPICGVVKFSVVSVTLIFNLFSLIIYSALKC